MTWGVTDSGFEIPQLSDLKAEVESQLKATFGANVDLSSSGPFGQVVGLWAEREYLIWAGMQDVYNSQYPDTAFGASLDNVGAISGILRLEALPSAVLGVKLFGDAGTLIPGTSTLFSVDGSPTNIFSLDGDVTLVAGQDCIQTISFSAVPDSGQWKIALNGLQTGALAYNADAAAVQVAIRTLLFASACTVTGDYTSGFTIQFNGAGTGGKMVQPEFTIPLNTLEASLTPVDVTPLITQAGLDQASVNVTATSDGPTLANAGTLSVINTPISGLSAVLNVTDAVLGRNTETDNAYRGRRATVLQIAGAGTFEAIRSRLLALSQVTAVIVFENVSLITDPNGLPAKSFEATVQGGEDQSIGNLLWQIKPAGIESFGTVPVSITDSQGQPHTVYFSRPVGKNIYVDVELTVNLNYPSNGDAAVKQAVVDAGNSLGIGKEVVVLPYLMAAIATVPGIETAVIKIGLAPGPSASDNISIAINEIAVFDTGRTNVSST